MITVSFTPEVASVASHLSSALLPNSTLDEGTVKVTPVGLVVSIIRVKLLLLKRAFPRVSLHCTFQI